MVNQTTILETTQNANNNTTTEHNWREPETEFKTQYGFKTRLKGDWIQGYIQTLDENTRYYPEVIYDNYLTHLEENGFLNKDGSMNLQNENFEQLPTLEQYTRQSYEVEEIDEQNSYELGTNTTQHTLPPIENTQEEDENTNKTEEE